MDTLIREVELLAKEKEAEGGTAHDGEAMEDAHAEAGWELIGHATDEHSTIVKRYSRASD